MTAADCSLSEQGAAVVGHTENTENSYDSECSELSMQISMLEIDHYLQGAIDLTCQIEILH